MRLCDCFPLFSPRVCAVFLDVSYHMTTYERCSCSALLFVFFTRKGVYHYLYYSPSSLSCDLHCCMCVDQYFHVCICEPLITRCSMRRVPHPLPMQSFNHYCSVSRVMTIPQKLTDGVRACCFVSFFSFLFSFSFNPHAIDDDLFPQITNFLNKENGCQLRQGPQLLNSLRKSK